MKRQLSMFDRTYMMLCKSVKDAEQAYELAQRRHRGQQHAWLILNACRNAMIKYEAKARQRDKAAA